MRVSLFFWIQLVVFLQIVECAKEPPRITRDQFNRAVMANGFPKPSQEKYDGFMKSMGYAGIEDKKEAAMYLSQLIRESGGLRYKEEFAYKKKHGERYYGRGYIQLSGAENYRKASRDIYGDDRLLQHPERVAKDDGAAFLTSGWYWKSRVAVVPGVKEGRFGEATKAINGGMECHGRNLRVSKKRFKYYKVVFHEFGAEGEPDERGCYN